MPRELLFPKPPRDSSPPSKGAVLVVGLIVATVTVVLALWLGLYMSITCEEVGPGGTSGAKGSALDHYCNGPFPAVMMFAGVALPLIGTARGVEHRSWSKLFSADALGIVLVVFPSLLAGLLPNGQ